MVAGVIAIAAVVALLATIQGLGVQRAVRLRQRTV
jgi:hypothetical protein